MTNIKWESEEVFHQGDKYFQALLAELDRAQVSIELESYIFDDDELGRRVASSLAAAAQRGVRVRVMVDGIGSPYWAGRFQDELNKAGVQSRIYHPIQVLLPIKAGTRRCLSRFNRRNHRKLCVIDGRIAYLGGMNISIRHLEGFSGADSWRDTSVRVAGPEVSELLQAFEAAWSGSPRKLSRQSMLPSPLVMLNHTNRKRRRSYNERIARIRSAGQRVWITTPYFVPRLTLARALRKAARSGVDVRILLPSKSDVIFMDWVNTAYYSLLLVAGVRIYEYQPRMIHAKVFIADDWITVGSTNLNHRSMIHDLEADVVLTHRESMAEIENHFREDLKESREITLKDWEQGSASRKVAGRLLFLLRYWM